MESFIVRKQLHTGGMGPHIQGLIKGRGLDTYTDGVAC